MRLNSGGPEMLVVDLRENAAVMAAWRDINGCVHEREYPNQCMHGTGEKSIQSSI